MGQNLDDVRKLLVHVILTFIPLAKSQPSVNVAVPGFSEVFGLGQGSGTEVGGLSKTRVTYELH